MCILFEKLIVLHDFVLNISYLIKQIYSNFFVGNALRSQIIILRIKQKKTYTKFKYQISRMKILHINKRTHNSIHVEL